MTYNVTYTPCEGINQKEKMREARTDGKTGTESEDGTQKERSSRSRVQEAERKAGVK